MFVLRLEERAWVEKAESLFEGGYNQSIVNQNLYFRIHYSLVTTVKRCPVQATKHF